MNELQILSMRDELEKIASPLVVPTLAHNSLGVLAVPYSGVTSVVGAAHSMSRADRKKLNAKQRKRHTLGSIAGGLTGSALAYKGSGKLIKRHVKNINKAVDKEYAPLLREAKKRQAKDLNIVLPKQTFDVKKMMDPSYKIDAPKTTKALVGGSSKLTDKIKKDIARTKASRSYDWMVNPKTHVFGGAGSKAKIVRALAMLAGGYGGARLTGKLLKGRSLRKAKEEQRNKRQMKKTAGEYIKWKDFSPDERLQLTVKYLQDNPTKKKLFKDYSHHTSQYKKKKKLSKYTLAGAALTTPAAIALRKTKAGLPLAAASGILAAVGSPGVYHGVKSTRKGIELKRGVKKHSMDAVNRWEKMNKGAIKRRIIDT